MSLMEAAALEAGFWEWVNVALDAADIAIPVATCPIGAGEICRFIRYACKSPAGKLVTASVGYADEVGDVARHTYRHVDNVGDIARSCVRYIDDASDAVKKVWNRIPDNDSVIGHIFRNADGHVPDTPANRALLEDVANDVMYFRGTDKYEFKWYVKNMTDGRQVWVQVRNGVIFEGGINDIPKIWNTETGLKKP